MKYKVNISQVWEYSTVIEADSRKEADDIAGEIAADVSPTDNIRHMSFKDEYVEVKPMKGGE